MINICFALMKFSSSVQMMALCGFFQAFAYMIECIRATWFDTGLFAGFGVWLLVAYALIFLNFQCGEEYLIKNQSRFEITSMFPEYQQVNGSQNAYYVQQQQAAPILVPQQQPMYV